MFFYLFIFLIFCFANFSRFFRLFMNCYWWFLSYFLLSALTAVCWTISILNLLFFGYITTCVGWSIFCKITWVFWSFVIFFYGIAWVVWSVVFLMVFFMPMKSGSMTWFPFGIDYLVVSPFLYPFASFSRFSTIISRTFNCLICFLYSAVLWVKFFSGYGGLDWRIQLKSSI